VTADSERDDAGDRSTVRAGKDGTFNYWGEDLAAVLGHTPEQAIGRSIDLIIPKPLHAWHWRGFDKAVNSGAMRKPGATVKVPALRRDGKIVAVRADLNLARAADGTVDGAEASNFQADSSWKTTAWKPVVALVGLAGRVGLRPRGTRP
jgi:PAS domain S-box-containing protein